MKPEELVAKLEELTAGHVPDLMQPVSMSESAVLRDRLRQLIHKITGVEDHYSQLDEKIATLATKMEDTEEVTKQFRLLAMRVNELVYRLKLLEENTKVVPISKKRSRKKKT